MATAKDLFQVVRDVLEILGIPSAIVLLAILIRQSRQTLKEQISTLEVLRPKDVIQDIKALQELLEHRRATYEKSLTEARADRDRIAALLATAESHAGAKPEATSSSSDHEACTAVREPATETAGLQKAQAEQSARIALLEKAIRELRIQAKAAELTQTSLSGRRGLSPIDSYKRYYGSIPEADPEFENSVEDFLNAQVGEGNKDLSRMGRQVTESSEQE